MSLPDFQAEDGIKLTRPPDWKNPVPGGRYHLAVIGGGPGGLVAAAAAAGLGAKVALIEKKALGGDCLHHGCVPSKSVIHSGHRHRSGTRLNLGLNATTEAFKEARKKRSILAAHDAADRFKAMGIDLFFGHARFQNERSLEAGGALIEFSKAIIATGGSPKIPPIPGLKESGYETTETLFERSEPLHSVAFIGGGPIACELGQALGELGAEVHLIEREDRLLPGEDPQCAALVEEAIKAQGIFVHCLAEIIQVSHSAAGKRIRFRSGHKDHDIVVQEIVISAGKSPNVLDLGLENAGVEVAAGRISVNERLQTSQEHLFAIGDVALPYQFTHLADATARLAVQNALFFPFKKWTDLTVPRCTYTSPALAHVADSPLTALHQEPFDVYVLPAGQLDKNQLEDSCQGITKVWTRRGTGKIAAVTVVDFLAGEMIAAWTIALTHGITLGDLSKTVIAYPTRSESLRKLGDLYTRTRFKPWMRRLLDSWFRWKWG